jgi:MFS family permease
MSVVTRRLGFARALRTKPFAMLWSGQTVSALGDGAFSTALAWQVLKLTGSATAMGAVLIARTIPMLIFLLIGGVAADRLPRRLVMLASDAGRGLAVLAIAILGWAHVLQLWHLIALGFFFGVVSGFFMPTYQSIAPELVATDDLPSANSLTGLSRQISGLLGPLLGAFLVARTGPQGAFAFDGLSFGVSALFLLAMRVPRRAAPPASGDGTMNEKPRRRGLRGVVADVGEGLRYITRSSWLWVTIAIASVANMGWSGAFTVAMPKLILDVYHADVNLYGLIATAEGAGAILATILIGQVKRLRHRGILAYLGLVIASFGLIAYGLPLPLGVLPRVALGASVVIGAAMSLFEIVWVTSLQQLVPSEKLGRVSSVDWLGSLAFQPIGFALAGVLADAVGPAWVFVGAGVMNAALCALALAVPGIRHLD